MRPQEPTTGPMDVSRALSVAVEAAEAAGVLLWDGAHGEIAISPKGSAGDVVTSLDIAAEQLILGRIRTAFPGHQIIAEESGILGAEDDAWVWLVDPLDGTNNLAVGLSAYVVGIALCADRLPVLGVVHDPVAGQTWSAVRGSGAHGPAGRLLPPSPRPMPHGPVLAWTQGHSVPRDDGTARALKLVLESSSRRLLQLWAPLLSWVMLARGDIDGIIGYQAEAVDLPAGLLIAVETDMAVCGFDGTPFDERIGRSEEDRSFVAGRQENIDRLLELVTSAERIEPDVSKLWVSEPIGSW